MANHLNCKSSQIVFTSGSTEANNLAILGKLSKLDGSEHVISSPVEHPSALAPLKRLHERGQIALTLLGVNSHGQINLNELADSIRPNTTFVSLMLANNELGTVYPISEAVQAVQERAQKQGWQRPWFHTDATQAPGRIPVDFAALGVDSLSLSAHKFYGPKGVGCLVLAAPGELMPLFFGGGQENGLRPGTLNTPGIVGMAEALKLSCSNLEQLSAHGAKLTQLFLDGLDQARVEYSLNSPEEEQRLPQTLSLTFAPKVKPEVLSTKILRIACSSTSACSSVSGVSPVLTAIGLSSEEAKRTFRFGFGQFNTEEEVKEAAAILIRAIKSSQGDTLVSSGDL